MYYLAFIRDTRVDASPLESILIVRDFLDIFSTDLPGVPLRERDIDFAIDLDPTELKGVEGSVVGFVESGVHSPKSITTGCTD